MRSIREAKMSNVCYPPWRLNHLRFTLSTIIERKARKKWQREHSHLRVSIEKKKPNLKTLSIIVHPIHGHLHVHTTKTKQKNTPKMMGEKSPTSKTTVLIDIHKKIAAAVHTPVR